MKTSFDRVTKRNLYVFLLIITLNYVKILIIISLFLFVEIQFIKFASLSPKLYYPILGISFHFLLPNVPRPSFLPSVSIPRFLVKDKEGGGRGEEDEEEEEEGRRRERNRRKKRKMKERGKEIEEEEEKEKNVWGLLLPLSLLVLSTYCLHVSVFSTTHCYFPSTYRLPIRFFHFLTPFPWLFLPPTRFLRLIFASALFFSPTHASAHVDFHAHADLVGVSLFSGLASRTLNPL